MNETAAEFVPGTRVAVHRIIHAIHVVPDLAACRARYLDLLGGLVFAEGYFEAEDRDMALLYVADFMMEPMAPRDTSRLEKHVARYLHRYGPGFQSFEIGVKNGPAAAAQFKAAGCKLSAEYGTFFYVRQESTGGILLEACDGAMPNDPHEYRPWRADYIVGHGSTLRGLDHIACITPDASASLSFFTERVDGELLLDERIESPQPARRVMIRLGGTRIAFIQPDDRSSGALGKFLAPPTSGIYAMVWRVQDEAAAQRFFQGKGARTTTDNCVSSGFAIDPADFLGARHEFVAST
jgi:catechol 2,3-dioxygenase-like lactoylglutathione lyase family enzyme